MQRSRLPLLVALVTFGLSLLSGLYAYNRTLRTVPALIVTNDVAPGTALTEKMVQVIRVPAGNLPPKALFGPGQIVGAFAVSQIYQDHILTAREITDRAPNREAATTLTPAQRIISVPVKSDAALGGALRPGDIVDVAAAWPGTEAKPGGVDLIAAGVQVVDLRNAAGQSTHSEKENETSINGVPTTVLLVVNGQQARSLVATVESKGAIYLWLVGRDHK
jgi:Flp pilus assembly protein CpaB